MSKEFKIMKKEFYEAIDSVKVEKGLSNVEAFKERYIKAFEQIVPIPNIAFGNKKVPETTAIVNTTSWFLCPGRLKGFCELNEVCYDKCREVMGSVCKSRLNHDLWWRTNDAQTIADFYIVSIKARNLKKPNQQVNLVRFQDSYTYTHNRDLPYNILKRPHLTINGSGFMIDNQFTVVPPSDFERYAEEHDCYKCPQKCELCNSICSLKLGIEIVEVLK